jgi:hypothetical protein
MVRVRCVFVSLRAAPVCAVALAALAASVVVHTMCIPHVRREKKSLSIYKLVLCGVYIQRRLSTFILHLWIFEENAVNCVLYATKTTKRQFQNKSLLGRICKLQVSRKKLFFF